MYILLDPDSESKSPEIITRDIKKVKAKNINQ